MKNLIALIVIFSSASSFACQCVYDWKDQTHIERAAALLEIPATSIKVTDYNVYNTPLALLARETYSQCGCTRYVRQVYTISFHSAAEMCTGKIVYSRNLDKIKVKQINCQ